MKNLSLPTEVRRDDPEIERIIEQYSPFLRQVVGRLCPAHLGVLASEIEQEARIRLWRTLRNERVINDFQSYIYRIVATSAIDAARQVKERREDPLSEEGEAKREPALIATVVTPEEMAHRRRLLARIEGMLNAFPVHIRQAVKLHLQGFTTEEIGRSCGWTEAKARNLSHRGLKRLRLELQAEGIESA